MLLEARLAFDASERLIRLFPCPRRVFSRRICVVLVTELRSACCSGVGLVVAGRQALNIQIEYYRDFFLGDGTCMPNL